MSFRFGNPTQGNQQTQDESWKAQGFINIYVPTKGGGKRKLGTIPLKESKPAEKALIDFLKANEKNAAILLSKMELNFQTAEHNESSDFDLTAPATGTNG